MNNRLKFPYQIPNIRDDVINPEEYSRAPRATIPDKVRGTRVWGFKKEKHLREFYSYYKELLRHVDKDQK